MQFGHFFVILRAPIILTAYGRRREHNSKKGQGKQPEGYNCRNTARQVRGRYGHIRFGKVIPCFRHPLRRRPETLRGEPLFICPAVPRTYVEAGCRAYRRHTSRYRHRAEGEYPQSTLYDSYKHGDIRLSAYDLRPYRAYILACDRRGSQVPYGRRCHEIHL